MYDWRKVQVKPETLIVDVMRVIDQEGLRIALVVDESQRLLGIVTDGDVRRGLLRSIRLDEPVKMVMNSSPVVSNMNNSKQQCLALMGIHNLSHIPLIDSEGCIVGLETQLDALKQKQHENWVLLMAGGLGERLRPLTDKCPKPLLKVGNKPILESILKNFVNHGFRRFYISVNYKAELMIDYFGDGTPWNADIQYLHEKKPLGTAGALSLIPTCPEMPMIVMNGDILTNINFEHLINFHMEHKAVVTMCVREYGFQIPYGVVVTDESRVEEIVEKPVHRVLANAGIYVLEPEVVQSIPRDTCVDMPEVLNTLRKKKKEIYAFPIHEYWLDIGQRDDFDRAHEEHGKYFQ
ncbi:MAG: alcohol dehydrogenase [Nitrospirales bacterium]|nr:MAG: alcohol dehydrogenase [Nitrospirales bacterium]